MNRYIERDGQTDRQTIGEKGTESQRQTDRQKRQMEGQNERSIKIIK